MLQGMQKWFSFVCFWLPFKIIKYYVEKGWESKYVTHQQIGYGRITFSSFQSGKDEGILNYVVVFIQYLFSKDLFPLVFIQ